MSPARGPALVIVPTYNESDSIAAVIKRLFDSCADAVELLVIDDGSPDGTAAIVKTEAAGRTNLHLIERDGKQGLGTAYVRGFEWGLARDYWAIVEMDGDLSHDPADVPRLLRELDGADLAIGSRYVSGGRVVNWGRVRRALSSGGNIYARKWISLPVRDSTSGFRAFRRAALEARELTSLRCEGYAFQIEMTRRVYRGGGRVVEISITFTERASGRSKMSRRVVIEAIYHVTAWGLKDRVLRRTRLRPAATPSPARDDG